jgi:hypothetical protein
MPTSPTGHNARRQKRARASIRRNSRDPSRALVDAKCSAKAVYRRRFALSPRENATRQFAQCLPDRTGVLPRRQIAGGVRSEVARRRLIENSLSKMTICRRKIDCIDFRR